MIRALAVALVAAALFVWLGLTVSHAPPHGIDTWSAAFAGKGTFAALVFTASSWWWSLLALAVVAILIAHRYPAWRARVVFALATTLVTWQASDALKNVFHRPRPGYWAVIHEPTFAYPSGHAMFSLVVFGLWGWFVWRSNLPRRVRLTLAPLLVLWAGGVLWSRLALGAHYVTDLMGGLLLGITALALATAVDRSIPRSFFTKRAREQSTVL